MELREPVNSVLPAKPEDFDPLLSRHHEKPYNRYRRAKLILFSSVFNHHEEFRSWPLDDRFKLVENIEKVCLKYSIDKAGENNVPVKWDVLLFRDIYTTICSKISSNIDQHGSVKNPYLAKAIFDGLIDLKTLPKMSSQDLYPDKYRTVLTRIEASKNVTRTIKTSAMYKCRRCHKNECVIDNRYNRSLDEGVNLTITCVSCGFEWNA